MLHYTNHFQRILYFEINIDEVLSFIDDSSIPVPYMLICFRSKTRFFQLIVLDSRYLKPNIPNLQ